MKNFWFYVLAVLVVIMLFLQGYISLQDREIRKAKESSMQMSYHLSKEDMDNAVLAYIEAQVSAQGATLTGMKVVALELSGDKFLVRLEPSGVAEHNQTPPGWPAPQSGGLLIGAEGKKPTLLRVLNHEANQANAYWCSRIGDVGVLMGSEIVVEDGRDIVLVKVKFESDSIPCTDVLRSRFETVSP